MLQFLSRGIGTFGCGKGREYQTHRQSPASPNLRCPESNILGAHSLKVDSYS